MVGVELVSVTYGSAPFFVAGPPPPAQMAVFLCFPFKTTKTRKNKQKIYNKTDLWVPLKWEILAALLLASLEKPTKI